MNEEGKPDGEEGGKQDQDETTEGLEEKELQHMKEKFSKNFDKLN